MKLKHGCGKVRLWLKKTVAERPRTRGAPGSSRPRGQIARRELKPKTPGAGSRDRVQTINRFPNCTLPMRRLLFLLLLMLTAMPLLSHAIEEPKYEVIRQFDGVELRQYAPYVVAEVVLDATADDAGSRAFPILAGYSFGTHASAVNLRIAAETGRSWCWCCAALTASRWENDPSSYVTSA
jgi:hypothetical protein